MKVLLTGATGFLGSHLTKGLVHEGHDVLILKRSFSNTWRITDVLSKITVFNIDQSSLEQPFIECGPIDAVIHTATKYDRKDERASELLEANVLFPLRLLETAIKYQTKVFINTDSYFHKNDIEYPHLAGYTRTKKQFLEWGKASSSNEKIRFINVWLEHIYGSFDSMNKFSTYIIRSCLNHIPELSLSPGDQRRDFIHVHDVISAYSLLLKKWESFPNFKEIELGTGKSVSIKEFIDLIHTKSQSRTKLYFGAIPHRENEIMDSKANIEELEKLGWKREIDLEKGIQMVLSDEKSIIDS